MIVSPLSGEALSTTTSMRRLSKSSPTSTGHYCERSGCPADCQRTCGVIPRNMNLLKSDLEPLALLHAWRDVDIDPGKGHRLTPVPDKKVIDFYEDHYDELSALRDLFMTP